MDFCAEVIERLFVFRCFLRLKELQVGFKGEFYLDKLPLISSLLLKTFIIHKGIEPVEPDFRAVFPSLWRYLQS